MQSPIVHRLRDQNCWHLDVVDDQRQLGREFEGTLSVRGVRKAHIAEPLGYPLVVDGWGYMSYHPIFSVVMAALTELDGFDRPVWHEVTPHPLSEFWFQHESGEVPYDECVYGWGLLGRWWGLESLCGLNSLRGLTSLCGLDSLRGLDSLWRLGCLWGVDRLCGMDRWCALGRVLGCGNTQSLGYMSHHSRFVDDNTHQVRPT